MNWPPNKSWTSTTRQNGFRHVVAINYGGKANDRWVLLVSVLDGKSRLIVKWNQMKDTSKWISGWVSLSRDEANPATLPSNSIQEDSEEVCLHPSRDSGLLIPSETKSIRPWDHK